MKAYHIFLLRHGMTQANKEGRYVGRTDVPLSDEGEEQIIDLGNRYRYPDVDAFYSSPLIRCTQTLKLLYPYAKPTLVQGLAECDFGDFEGKTVDELRDDPDYRDWIMKKGEIAPPNGESGQAFQQRCCGAFESIVEELLCTGVNRAAIMAHGGTLMFLLATYGYPRRPYYKWLAGNGMGYEVVITPQLWMSGKAMDIAARIPEEMEDENLNGLTQMRDEAEAEYDE